MAFHQSVDNKPVYPCPVQEDFPFGCKPGGNVESTIKIARKGLPIVYAVIVQVLIALNHSWWMPILKVAQTQATIVRRPRKQPILWVG